MDGLHRALGQAWTDDAPWEFLTDLIECGNRMGGHPGEARAATVLAAELESIGIREVTVDSFGMTRWDRGTATVRVVDPVSRSFEALGLPYSPGETVRGKLVDVGAGTPEEIDAAALDGAIALASTDTPSEYGRFVHRLEKVGHAADAGAIGFIFHNHITGQLPPTGALRFADESPMPGVGVSRETGAWLTDYAARDARVELGVEASTTHAESHNVHGVLGRGDTEILVVAHLDAHDIAEGALDNGCGVAVLIGVAQILAAADLDARVRLAGVGAEEIGLLGATELAGQLDLGQVTAVVNLDGAGRFRDLRAFNHGTDELAALTEGVTAKTNHPIVVENRVHPFSDHWPFLRRGVPSLQLHSESGERGRGWGHTAADTRDKVEPRNLREHAMLAAVFISELADVDLARIESETTAAALRDRGLAPGMRAAGIWPTEWD